MSRTNPGIHHLPDRPLQMKKTRRLPRFTAALIAALFVVGNAGAADNEPALTSEFVYKYLVGEVAGQRGEIGLASSLFYELAETSNNAALAERAARAAAYGNMQQLAVKAAMLWAELDPASIEAHQAIAQMLISTGKLSDALPHLQKLLEIDKTRAQGFLYLNGILSRHPNKDEVLQLVQQLAEPYPELPEAQFTVAHCAWNAGETETALKALELAEKLQPGWQIAAQLHGEILLQNNPDDATAFYQKFLNRYPKSHDVRLAYAKLLVNLKQLEPARKQFKLLVDQAGANPEIPVVVGLLAGQLGDYKEADRFLKLALDKGYKEAEQIYLYLGQSAERQNQDAKALEWYRRIKGETHLFDAQLRIAGVLARTEGLEPARNYLQQLANLSSEQQAAAYQLEASLLMRAGQPQDAFAVLEKAIKTTPNTPDMIYDYAMAAEKTERLDVMEKQLRLLIKLRPDYAMAYNALGYSLADRNERLSEAYQLIDQALKLSPDDHYILDSMGWVQYRLGNLEPALEFLQRAYAVQNDPEIAAHLGEVMWQKGDREAARKTLKEAQRAFPDNEILNETVKKFLQ